MIMTIKRGINVAKVDEVKNKMIGAEGCWNEIVIAIVNAAIKRALKNSEMYSAIFVDETLTAVPFLLCKFLLSVNQAVCLKRLVFCIPDLILVNTLK